MIIIKRYLHKNEAYLDKSLLNSHGIRAEIRGDDLGSNAPYMAYNFNVSLLVHELEKETSCKLLEGASHDFDNNDQASAIEKEESLSDRIQHQVRHAFNSAIISFFIPIIATIFSIYTCINIAPNFSLLNANQRKKYLLAILINALVLVFYFALFYPSLW